MRTQGIKIFYEIEVSQIFAARRRDLANKVVGESSEYLGRVDEQEYARHVADLFKIEPVSLDFEGLYAEELEREVPAEEFPSNFNVYEGERYRKPVFRYVLPFSGDSEQLGWMPDARLLWTERLEITSDGICFDVVAFWSEPERIKQRADELIRNIRSQYSGLVRDIGAFNAKLESEALAAIRSRKTELGQTSKVAAGLGVPIRKRDAVSPTFAVPQPKIRQRIVMERPTASPSAVPEPTLAQDVYEQILRTVHEVGKQFERMPSTYRDKTEEELRDHILLFLEPNFQGTATGETFNKTGKTDILLRHNGTNVFVAECKYWGGEKAFLGAIDQLLGYLTWRDSKTALIVFVDAKDFSRTLAIMRSGIEKHLLFARMVGESDETWFNVELRFPEDSDRKLYMAVMAYHVPAA